MALTNQQVAILAHAISDYDYPKVTYDFQKGLEVSHDSMRDVEALINRQLTSSEPEEVKHGLANVLYWGWASNSGMQATRVDRFLKEITDEQLAKFSKVTKTLDESGLKSVGKLGMPQFSNMSFVSKIVMFLNPSLYVILDIQLQKLSREFPRNLFWNVEKYKTYIRISNPNHSAYVEWCNSCRNAAETYFSGQGIIAVDIERGIFRPVQNKELKQAAQIVADL